MSTPDESPRNPGFGSSEWCLSSVIMPAIALAREQAHMSGMYLDPVQKSKHTVAPEWLCLNCGYMNPEGTAVCKRWKMCMRGRLNDVYLSMHPSSYYWPPHRKFVDKYARIANNPKYVEERKKEYERREGSKGNTNERRSSKNPNDRRSSKNPNNSSQSSSNSSSTSGTSGTNKPKDLPENEKYLCDILMDSSLNMTNAVPIVTVYSGSWAWQQMYAVNTEERPFINQQGNNQTKVITLSQEIIRSDSQHWSSNAKTENVGISFHGLIEMWPTIFGGGKYTKTRENNLDCQGVFNGDICIYQSSSPNKVSKLTKKDAPIWVHDTKYSPAYGVGEKSMGLPITFEKMLNEDDYFVIKVEGVVDGVQETIENSNTKQYPGKIIVNAIFQMLPCVSDMYEVDPRVTPRNPLLTLYNIAGNGNCQFAAGAYVYNKYMNEQPSSSSGIDQMGMRKMIQAHMNKDKRKWKEKFELETTKEGGVKNYIKSIDEVTKDKTWGGNTTLIAMNEVLNTPIVVVKTSGTINDIQIYDKDGSQTGENVVVFEFNGSHYNVYEGSRDDRKKLYDRVTKYQTAMSKIMSKVKKNPYICGKSLEKYYTESQSSEEKVDYKKIKDQLTDEIKSFYQNDSSRIVTKKPNTHQKELMEKFIDDSKKYKASYDVIIFAGRIRTSWSLLYDAERDDIVKNVLEALLKSEIKAGEESKAYHAVLGTLLDGLLITDNDDIKTRLEGTYSLIQTMNNTDDLKKKLYNDAYEFITDNVIHLINESTSTRSLTDAYTIMENIYSTSISIEGAIVFVRHMQNDFDNTMRSFVGREISRHMFQDGYTLQTDYDIKYIYLYASVINVCTSMINIFQFDVKDVSPIVEYLSDTIAKWYDETQRSAPLDKVVTDLWDFKQNPIYTDARYRTAVAFVYEKIQIIDRNKNKVEDTIMKETDKDLKSLEKWMGTELRNFENPSDENKGIDSFDIMIDTCRTRGATLHDSTVFVNRISHHWNTVIKKNPQHYLIALSMYCLWWDNISERDINECIDILNRIQVLESKKHYTLISLIPRLGGTDKEQYFIELYNNTHVRGALDNVNTDLSSLKNELDGLAAKYSTVTFDKQTMDSEKVKKFIKDTRNKLEKIQPEVSPAQPGKVLYDLTLCYNGFESQAGSGGTGGTGGTPSQPNGSGGTGGTPSSTLKTPRRDRPKIATGYVPTTQKKWSDFKKRRQNDTTDRAARKLSFT